MKDSSSRLFAGIFILIVVLLCVGAIGAASEDNDICAEDNCYSSREDGSRYCYRHEPGSLFYKQESYREWKSTSQATKPTSSTTYKSFPYRSYSGSGKSYHSYDEGYDDIYFNEDYDMDRYYSDDDYARGADDAMDDEDW